jgi:DNA-binding transcriptional LysR family regulator
MSVPSDRLQLMTTFIRIVETGSISGAARDLRLAQSTISRQLRQLEELLGITLLQRTTHKVSVTDAGRLFLADCHRMIEDWGEIEARFREEVARPRGKLKVVASVGLGQLVLVEFAARYCRRYPEVELDWRVDDGPVSMLESGIDCLIKVGRITEESVVVRVAAYVRAVVVAAPELVAERGAPATPAGLRSWPMISVQPYFNDTILLRDKRGKSAKARGKLRFATRNVLVARSAARAGAGFTLLPQWLVDPEIRAGNLQRLLPGWEGEPRPLCIGTLPTKHKQVKVSLFIEEILRGLHEFPGLLRNPTSRFSES